LPKTGSGLDELSEVLRKLVLRAGDLLRNRLGASHEVRHKGEIDLVTEMDREVEALFIQTLRRRLPKHEVLSEEMAEDAGRRTRRRPATSRSWRWIVDPLDGTTNYAHGLPHFAVSAGLEREGRILLGAVYDPMLREYFFARRGGGAWLNGRPIRVSAVADVNQALLATGFPYDVRTSRENNFAYFQAMAVNSQAVRRAGAAALDLCGVACGRFDGFWELKLKPWDVAAGSLLVTEAGGRITDFSGRRFDLFGGSFLASNGRIHGAMARILAAASS
jgi:myo-inositol-1(or 4)-monophosphatase